MTRRRTTVFDDLAAIALRRRQMYGEGEPQYEPISQRSVIHECICCESNTRMMYDPNSSGFSRDPHEENICCKKAGCIPHDPKPRRWVVEYPDYPQADWSCGPGEEITVKNLIIREVVPISKALVILAMKRAQLNLKEELNAMSATQSDVFAETLRELNIEVQE